MSNTNQIVVRPFQLDTVAGRFSSVSGELSDVTRRLNVASIGVRLNHRDPRAVAATFQSRRFGVEQRLSQAGIGWDDDSRVLRVTVDEAVAADSGLGLLGRFDRVAEVVDSQPPSMRRGVFYEELLAHRAELLNEVAGGSRPAGAVLGEYSAWGGSLRDVFESVASDDGATLERTVHELAAEGLVAEARQLDQVLAVTRLLLADASGELGSFDELTEGGVDVAVAANVSRIGGMPSGGELEDLVDRLAAVFGREGGRIVLSDHDWARLPLSMRLELVDGVVAPTGGDSAMIQSQVYDGRFSAGGDHVDAQLRVIGELGRAGLDLPQSGETLAGMVAEMVMPTPGGGLAELSTHQAAAAVVGDPTTEIDAAFFRLLGVDGARALAESVGATAPFAVSDRRSSGTAQSVLARYGDGMAAADRRGQLGFGAAELFGDDPAVAWSSGGYLGASTGFSRQFALDAAAAMIDVGRAPGSYGVADPRGMAIEQVARHGGAAAVELFDLLGDDFLDELLWNPEPIESAEAVHPVYQLMGPVLDDPRLRPGLAAEIVVAAGERHADGPAPLHTGDVVQHAFLSDKFLLAPVHAYRLGGAQSTGYMDRFPNEEDVVNAIEVVYASGSGDGLIAFRDGIVPHIFTEAVNVEGAAWISPDTDAVYTEIIGKLNAGEFNVALHQAMGADARIGRAKFVGSAVATALPGALPMKGAVSVGTGLAVNLGSGPAFDLMAADNTLGVYEDDWVEVREIGADYRAQAAYALAAAGAVDLTHCSSSEYFDEAYFPVTSAGGTPSGALYEWIRAASHMHSVAAKHEADVVGGGD